MNLAGTRINRESKDGLHKLLNLYRRHHFKLKLQTAAKQILVLMTLW